MEKAQLATLVKQTHYCSRCSDVRFSHLGVRIAIPSNVATAASEEPPPSI
jgi:hypothetical protein